ncbi:MAG: type II-A CRISPR-associated protein Csn2 [Spirochaetia bacterium]|jgi:CRISPR type II-A-associated protein Csn2|nr:type II-A CRISPR-associated protein Csn2 [Spirochaetia bacterium]
MNLVHPELCFKFSNIERKSLLLVIEAPSVFSQVLTELKNQSEGNSGLFVLSEEEKIMPLDKNLKVIIDPLAFDPNDKIILNAINKQVEEDAINEYHYEATNKLISMLKSYAIDLAYDFPGAITPVEEIPINAIIKALSFHVDTLGNSLVEHIFDSVLSYNKYMHYSLFCFVNLMNFLPMNEITKLIESCIKESIAIMFIEAKDISIDKELFQKVVIDTDFCQF